MTPETGLLPYSLATPQHPDGPRNGLCPQPVSGGAKKGGAELGPRQGNTRLIGSAETLCSLGHPQVCSRAGR